MVLGLMVSVGGCGDKGPQGLPVQAYWGEGPQVKSEGNIKDGDKDGRWVLYYKNGQMKSEGNYKLKKGKKSEVTKPKSATKTKKEISYSQIEGCWQTHQVVDCFQGKSVTRYFLTEALQMQSNPRADLGGGIIGPWTGNYYVKGDKVIRNFNQGNPNYMGSHVSIHEEFTVKSKSDNTISITMKSGTNSQMTLRTDSQFRYGVGGFDSKSSIDYDLEASKKRGKKGRKEMMDALEGWTNTKKGRSYKDGKWIYYYENGQIEKEENYVISTGLTDKYEQKDGKWIYYYENGQIEKEEEWYYGRRGGKQVEYYPNGKIRSEGNYKIAIKDGKNFSQKDGSFVEYNKDGQIAAKREYKEGERWSGKWVKYHENGQLSWEENYKDGEKDGQSVEYNKDGQIVAKSEYKGGKIWNGSFVEYWDDGLIRREGNYKDGKLHNYKNFRYGWPLKAKQLAVEKSYYVEYDEKKWHGGSHPIEHGPYVEYYGNGQIKSEANWKHGKLAGKFAKYYESGKVQEEGNYSGGTFQQEVFHGKWVWYYPNGKISWEGNYKNGAKDCIWFSYEKSGELRGKSCFYEGKRVRSMNYCRTCDPYERK